MTDTPSPLLAGRRILVTGGARGIGAAVVDKLAAHGADGAIVDLHAPAASPWPAVAADVTDEAAMRDAVGSLAAEGGAFNGLVAAAGIVPAWHTPGDLDLDVLDRTLAVNLRGFVVAMKVVSPGMPAGSTIVAIGSLNSWRGDPNLLAYAASKHAVLGAVRSQPSRSAPPASGSTRSHPARSPPRRCSNGSTHAPTPPAGDATRRCRLPPT